MSDIEAALAAQEERRIAAVTAGDIEGLAELLSDELIYVHNNGLQETKTEYLATAAKIDYRAFEPSEVTIRSYDDVGIVNGRAAIEVEFQGREMAMQVRYTAVYRREGDTWRMISWHASAVQ